jgi:predicted O-methyltransferase YrrM
LILRGTQAEIFQAIERITPGVSAALRVARETARGRLLEWQAAALFALARPFVGGNILEIGTFLGYSATVIAQAAPKATITTLNSSPIEAGLARKHLSRWSNVSVLEQRSWDYLVTDKTIWDMIFVDGDHVRIARDLPWFNRLRVGGLILFHDYSPRGGPSACPPVYAALNDMAAKLHAFDVQIADENQTGLAGFYRHEGETW